MPNFRPLEIRLGLDISTLPPAPTPGAIGNAALEDQAFNIAGLRYNDPARDLELVGDSYIGALVVEYLTRRYTTLNVNHKTLLKSAMVRNDTLCILATALGFVARINVNGQLVTGLDNYSKTRANSFEAWIGAYRMKFFATSDPRDDTALWSWCARVFNDRVFCDLDDTVRGLLQKYPRHLQVGPASTPAPGLHRPIPVGPHSAPGLNNAQAGPSRLSPTGTNVNTTPNSSNGQAEPETVDIDVRETAPEKTIEKVQEVPSLNELLTEAMDLVEELECTMVEAMI